MLVVYLLESHLTYQLILGASIKERQHGMYRDIPHELNKAAELMISDLGQHAKASGS